MDLIFGYQAYQSPSLPLAAQRCVNMFAELQPQEAKYPIAAFHAPGTKAFEDGLAGAVRGSQVMGGVLYIVAGNTVYSVSSGGTATSLGTIDTFNGPVSMAANAASTQQLCIVDGQDGWIYDTSGGLQQIVDASFKAADTVTFMDGYFAFNESGTSRWFISNLNDGLTYTATDFATAESHPDNVVAVYENHGELWVFGAESVEVYYNSGDLDFPFQRIQGAHLERGCAAAFGISDEDNTLFWLADNGTVVRADGYKPTRISTHAIEGKIEEFSTWSDAQAIFYTLKGHAFYQLTFPTGGYTFIYDVATGLWHERESDGARYYRSTAHQFVYGKHIVGDAFVGRLGELDLKTHTEYGEVIQAIVSTPVIHDGRRRQTHHELELDIEAGVGLTSGQGSDPQLWIEYSDDGGRSFSLRKPFFSIGKLGDYTERLRWNRLGQSIGRIYQLTIADPVKRTVLAATLRITTDQH